MQLIKIKTLADAGVPLARIKELLAADADRFAAAMAEIDRNLHDRIEELTRTRERIAHLHAGDRPFVSAQVADFLDELREIGVSQRAMSTGRPSATSWSRSIPLPATSKTTNTRRRL